MKKFLIYCLVIVVVLFLGFTTYYFIGNSDKYRTVVAETTIIKLNLGEEFLMEQIIKAPSKNKLGDIPVSVADSTILSYNKTETKFTAVGAGNTTFKLTPPNKKYGPYTYIVKVGDGASTENPVYISTLAQLKTVGGVNSSWTVDMNYELSSDIYLSGEEWVPLALNSAFNGTFDGNNHTIYGMTMTSSTSSNYAGFFYSIGTNGLVQNLKFSDVRLTGSFTYMGVVAGLNTGYIGLCEVGNAILSNTNASGYTGGIAGANESLNQKAQIGQCFVADIDITVNGFGGGIAGKNIASTIHNSAFIIKSLAINGGGKFGGIVGQNHLTVDGSKFSNSIIEYCYAILTNVDLSNGSAVGGIVAENKEYTSNLNVFTRNYYVANTSINPVLSNYNHTGSSVSFGSNPDKITSRLYADMKTALNYVNWDFTEIWTLRNSDNYAKINFDANIKGSISGGTYSNNPQDNNPIIIEEPDGGIVIEDGKIVEPSEFDQIKTAIRSMRLNPSSSTAYGFRGNIVWDLATEEAEFSEWVPIGTKSNPFKGQFGFSSGTLTIKNLRIKNGYEHAGMFGVLGSGAVISGITIENVQSTSTAATKNTGGLVGLMEVNSTVSNCKVNGIIVLNGQGSVGAIAGTNNGTISNTTVAGVSGCNISSTISSAYIGGLVGINIGTIKNSSVTGIALSANNATSTYMGGIAGQNSGIITDSFVKNTSLSETSASNSIAGGIAGTNSKVINKSYANNVSINASTSNSQNIAGGIVGINLIGGNVQVSSWVGNATIQSYSIGGIIGTNSGTVTMCNAGTSNALGTVKGSFVGGLASTNQESGKINNCYVLSSLVGVSNSGSVSGLSNTIKVGSVIEYCFSATTITGNGEFYADSSTAYKTFGKEIWDMFNGTTTGGTIANCCIVNKSNVTAQPSFIGIFGKDEHIISEQQATGSDNYKCFTDKGFGEYSVWKFTSGSYPTILSSPNIA